MIRIILFFFLASIIAWACSRKEGVQETAPTTTVSFNDSIEVDTVILQYELVVANLLHKKKKSIEETRVWLRFPDSLRFENFKTKYPQVKKQLKKNPLDFSLLNTPDHSEESVRAIMDSLNRKYRQIEGPNFNGCYYLLTTEIDDDCCFHCVVDLESGQIVQMVSSLWGADFRKDSYLLLLNPIKDIYDFHFYDKSYDIGHGYYPASSRYRKPEAYLFLDGELKQVF